MKGHKNIILSLATVVTILSCSSPNADWLAEGMLPEPAAKPAYYVAVGDGNMHVLDEHEDVYKANVSCPLAITVENKIVNAGTEGVTIITKSIAVTATGDYTVRYSVNGVEYSYIAKVSCDVTFEGYTLKPLRSLSVVVEGAGEVVRDTPFYQEFAANNVFMFGDDVVVDEAVQEIAVKEGAAIFDRAELLKSEHQYFIKEAEVKNDTLIIKGVNQATFKEYWKKQASDSTAIIKKEYPLEYRHLISAPNSGVVDDLEAVLNKKIAVKNGKATLGGEWEFTYLETICSKVEHRGVDYTEKVVKCSPEVRTLMALNTETVEICAYEHSEEDCSMVQLPFILKEREPEATLDRVEYNQQHVNFVREAVVSGTVAKVTCNEAMDFVEIFTDESSRNEEKVSFTIKSNHQVNGLSFEVEKPSRVINKTYYFESGKANIEGNEVTVEEISTKVESKVVYRGKDYTDKVNVHKHTPWTITFLSENQAVIRFYNGDANDYAEASLSADLREKVTIKETRIDYTHLYYHNNVEITSNGFDIICENQAVQTKVYSDGTEVVSTVNYTVRNKYLYNNPAIIVDSKDKVLNNSYAVVNGKTTVYDTDVNIEYVGNEKSDIIFDGSNYKNSAPDCGAEVSTIKYVSVNKATVYFNDNGKEETREIPANIVEAEKINGKIIGGWLTDAYKSQVSSYEKTDLHLLVENNGTYTIYTRSKSSTAWERTTSISSTQYEYFKNSGYALADVWRKNSYWEVGVVNPINRQEKGYILEYNYFGETGFGLSYRLGKSNETIGSEWRYPVRGIVSDTDNDGIWTMTYQDGETGADMYFIGTK